MLSADLGLRGMAAVLQHDDPSVLRELQAGSFVLGDADIRKLASSGFASTHRAGSCCFYGVFELFCPQHQPPLQGRMSRP